jgi:uncharacterized membrane protein (TIGR02234 family)
MRRARSTTILAVISAAVVVLVAMSQPWFRIQISEGVGRSVIDVSGTDASGVIAALSFGLLASAGVLLITSVIWRYFSLTVAALLGVAGVSVVMSTLASPLNASQAVLSNVTGVSDMDSLQSQTVSVLLTLWPTVATTGFAIAILASVLGLATAWNWRSASSRFNRPEKSEARAAADSRIDGSGEAWDRLSHGTDPTG